jgi:hypothetical protein
LTLRVWSTDELMELISSRKVGIYLTDLQSLRSDCEMKSQATITQRAQGPMFGPRQEPPVKHEIDDVVDCVRKIKELCEESGWEQARMKASMVDTYIKYNRDWCDWSSFAADLRNIYDVLMSEMWNAKLVKVLQPYYEHVNNDSLIGGEFNKKFPSAVGDIREAGNCIAVDCGTAAVFHLMRGVEWEYAPYASIWEFLMCPERRPQFP